MKNNRPDALISATPFDVVKDDSFAAVEIESAFLSFDDDSGRRCEVYAARCAPADVGPHAVVMHLPGGSQTVDPVDLSWWVAKGFACVSFDWQITDQHGHDPKRKSRWPRDAMLQSSGESKVEQLVLPLAVRGAGVCIDWLAIDKRFDVQRVGVAGISWGGYLAWLVGAYESRVKALVPVFGSGGTRDDRFYRPCALKTTGEARD